MALRGMGVEIQVFSRQDEGLCGVVVWGVLASM